MGLVERESRALDLVLVHDDLGAIKVNSGYRSPGYNASIDGATHSRHMFGDGFDFVGTGVSLTTAENACTANAGFLVEYNSHVHCDWRGTAQDPGFFGIAAQAGTDELDLATFQGHLVEDQGRWFAPATGFDEGEPLRRWRALDHDGVVLVEATGEWFAPPHGAVRIEVSVGAVVSLATELSPPE